MRGGRGASVSVSSGSSPGITRPAKSGLAMGSGTVLTVSIGGTTSPGAAATAGGRATIGAGSNSQSRGGAKAPEVRKLRTSITV
ncbi:hypothetical protein ACFSKM_19525 [Ancylobacter dichloromethanicus]